MTIEVGQRDALRSRYLYPGLIASLAINLLVFGGVAAAVWHHRHAGPRAFEPGLLGFVKELPADRQGVVRQEITAARESMKDQRSAVRKAWVDTNAMLNVEPFDKAKFKAALGQLAEVEARYKTALNDALAETAAKLGPDERKLLQSWREKRRPWALMRKGEDPNEDKNNNTNTPN